MADVFAFAEQRDGTLRGVAHAVVSAAAELAKGLGGRVQALAVGQPGLAASCGELRARGADVIRVAERDDLARYQPEVYARIVADAVTEGAFAVVMFPATSTGKDPRAQSRGSSRRSSSVRRYGSRR